MLNVFSSLVIILITVSLLFGCSGPTELTPTTRVDHPDSLLDEVDLSILIRADDAFPLLIDNALTLISPQSMQSAQIIELDRNQLPGQVDFSTFKLSPSNRYISWFAPQQGLIVYRLEADQSPRVVYQPSEWFLLNAHFEFHPQDDVIYLVDNNGEDFISIDINSDLVQSTPIPFPFGTIFSLSPDAQYVVFTSGYQQDAQWPSYLFTTIDMQDPVRFESQGELSDRHMITWITDNTQVVVVESQSLRLYDRLNPESSQKFYSPNDGFRVSQLHRHDDRLFVQTQDGIWHVLNANDGQLKARIPPEIASELNRPVFTPASADQFLIQEQIWRDESVYYHRLWLSDFRGIKNLLVPEFGKTITQRDY